jgi:hypothetical protein
LNFNGRFNMKKAFLGLAAILLAAMVFTSCGNAAGDAGPKGDNGAIVGAAGSLDGLRAFLSETASGTFYYVGNEALNAGDTLTIGATQRVVVLPWDDLNGRAVKPANSAVAGITLAGGTVTLTGAAQLKVAKGARLALNSGVFAASATSFIAFEKGVVPTINAAVTGIDSGAVFAFEDSADLALALADLQAVNGGAPKVLPGSINPDDATLQAKAADDVVLIVDPEAEIDTSGKTLVVPADWVVKAGVLSLKAGAYTFAGTSSIDPATGELTIGSTLTLTGGAAVTATQAGLGGDNDAALFEALNKITGDVTVSDAVAIISDLSSTDLVTTPSFTALTVSGSGKVDVGAAGVVKAATLVVGSQTSAAAVQNITLNGATLDGGGNGGDIALVGATAGTVTLTGNSQQPVISVGSESAIGVGLKIVVANAGTPATLATKTTGDVLTLTGGAAGTSKIGLADGDGLVLADGSIAAYNTGETAVTTFGPGSYVTTATAASLLLSSGVINPNSNALTLSGGAAITTKDADTLTPANLAFVRGAATTAAHNADVVYTAAAALGADISLNGLVGKVVFAAGGTVTKLTAISSDGIFEFGASATLPANTALVVNGSTMATLVLGGDLTTTTTLKITGHKVALNAGGGLFTGGITATYVQFPAGAFSVTGKTFVPSASAIGFEATAGLVLTGGASIVAGDTTFGPGKYVSEGAASSLLASTGVITPDTSLTLSEGALITTKDHSTLSPANLAYVRGAATTTAGDADVVYTDAVTLGASPGLNGFVGKVVFEAGGTVTALTAITTDGVFTFGGNVTLPAGTALVVNGTTMATLVIGADVANTPFTPAQTFALTGNKATLDLGGGLFIGGYTGVGTTFPAATYSTVHKAITVATGSVTFGTAAVLTLQGGATLAVGKNTFTAGTGAADNELVITEDSNDITLSDSAGLKFGNSATSKIQAKGTATIKSEGATADDYVILTKATFKSYNDSSAYAELKAGVLTLNYSSGAPDLAITSGGAIVTKGAGKVVLGTESSGVKPVLQIGSGVSSDAVNTFTVGTDGVTFAPAAATALITAGSSTAAAFLTLGTVSSDATPLNPIALVGLGSSAAILTATPAYNTSGQTAAYVEAPVVLKGLGQGSVSIPGAQSSSGSAAKLLGSQYTDFQLKDGSIVLGYTNGQGGVFGANAAGFKFTGVNMGATQIAAENFTVAANGTITPADAATNSFDGSNTAGAITDSTGILTAIGTAETATITASGDGATVTKASEFTESP